MNAAAIHDHISVIVRNRTVIFEIHISDLGSFIEDEQGTHPIGRKFTCHKSYTCDLERFIAMTIQDEMIHRQTCASQRKDPISLASALYVIDKRL